MIEDILINDECVTPSNEDMVTVKKRKPRKTIDPVIAKQLKVKVIYMCVCTHVYMCVCVCVCVCLPIYRTINNILLINNIISITIVIIIIIRLLDFML